MPHARPARCWIAVVVLALAALVSPAAAADSSTSTRSGRRTGRGPMFEEFEKATGIKVNFVRFSSGEALARVIAEKNNPARRRAVRRPGRDVRRRHRRRRVRAVQAAVLRRAAGALQAGRRPVDRHRRRSARVHDQRQVPEGEQPARRRRRGTTCSTPAYKNMLQMADARTSGTAVTRIFSILEVNGRDENKAFDYMKKLRPNVQLYTKSGGGGTLPVGPRPGGRRHLLHRRRARHQGQGLRRDDQLPEGRHRHRGRGHRAASRAPRIPSAGKKLIDWATSPAMQNLFAKYKINFVPAHPDVRARAEPRRGAEGRQDLPHRRRLRRRQPQAHRRALDRRSAEPVDASAVARPAARSAPRAPGAHRDPVVAVTALVLWLLLGAVRRLPAGDAARADADRPRHVHARRHRDDPHRPAPDPRLLEQPAAGARWSGSRGTVARLPVRVHRGARRGCRAGSWRAIDAARAAAAGLAAVHDGDRDDLLVRAARAHHLRPAGPQGRHRLRPARARCSPRSSPTFRSPT